MALQSCTQLSFVCIILVRLSDRSVYPLFGIPSLPVHRTRHSPAVRDRVWKTVLRMGVPIRFPSGYAVQNTNPEVYPSEMDQQYKIPGADPHGLSHPFFPGRGDDVFLLSNLSCLCSPGHPAKALFQCFSRPPPGNPNKTQHTGNRARGSDLQQPGFL